MHYAISQNACSDFKVKFLTVNMNYAAALQILHGLNSSIYFWEKKGNITLTTMLIVLAWCNHVDRPPLVTHNGGFS
jgi:hypothetical protein